MMGKISFSLFPYDYHVIDYPLLSVILRIGTFQNSQCIEKSEELSTLI